MASCVGVSGSGVDDREHRSSSAHAPYRHGDRRADVGDGGGRGLRAAGAWYGEAIWPAQDPARTRPRFWQSVTEARKALGDAWLHQAERYQIDRSKVRVDLDQLDGLLTTVNSQDADPAALESALALWRGEPLEGSDYLWADGEIRSLRATLLDLHERVGHAQLARGNARGALQMAEQAIALDTLHEPSWRLALQAEHSLGLRESITRRYDELARSLDEELGLEPARETRVIYRQLLGQN
jgi:two-component SAPR family response regulator